MHNAVRIRWLLPLGFELLSPLLCKTCPKSRKDFVGYNRDDGKEHDEYQENKTPPLKSALFIFSLICLDLSCLSRLG
jgi:hypothetical protein